MDFGKIILMIFDKREDRPPESDSSNSFTRGNTQCLIQDAVRKTRRKLGNKGFDTTC